MMPQRTQQSTTANQNVAPPGDRGDGSLVDLHNAKIRKYRSEASGMSKGNIFDYKVWAEPRGIREIGMRTATIQIIGKDNILLLP